jgi:hypothetical protein
MQDRCSHPIRTRIPARLALPRPRGRDRSHPDPPQRHKSGIQVWKSVTKSESVKARIKLASECIIIEESAVEYWGHSPSDTGGTHQSQHGEARYHSVRGAFRQYGLL